VKVLWYQLTHVVWDKAVVVIFINTT